MSKMWDELLDALATIPKVEPRPVRIRVSPATRRSLESLQGYQNLIPVPSQDGPAFVGAHIETWVHLPDGQIWMEMSDGSHRLIWRRKDEVWVELQIENPVRGLFNR